MIKEKRPWGEFKIIHKEPGITIKILILKPQKRLSLQSHKLRDEIWLILKGKAIYQLDEIQSVLIKGISETIPRGFKHRLISGEKGCRVLEISFGKFNEKDIVRYEDDYGRIKATH